MTKINHVFREPIILCLLLLVSGSVLSTSRAAPPTLARVIPLAGSPGQIVELTVFGDHLNNISHIWTSFPARYELLPTEEGDTAAKQVTFRLILPQELQVGIGGIRIVTSEGISSLKLFMLDDLLTARNAGGNQSLATAHDVSLPAAMDGACESLLSDFYGFMAAAGQRLAVEVVGQRLGSKIDPIVRLLDAEGQEMSYCDDRLGFGADCRFEHQFSKDGQYFIEIRDVQYRGGPEYFYRLRLGDFPLATTAYPLGAPAGSVTTFFIAGSNIDIISSAHVHLPEIPGSVVNLSVRRPRSDGSSFVSVVTSNQHEFAELEPNNDAESATEITVPCVVNGRFELPADRDVFQFKAHQGQHYTIRGLTRSLGSPADLLLRILNAKGDTLAQVDDAGGKNEGLLDFKCPAEGQYFLAVEDLLRAGGPAYAYRVEIKPFDGGFVLSVENETLNVPNGGTGVTKVTAQRRNYQGPIELFVDGEDDDIQLANNTIPKGKNETSLKMTFPVRFDPGQWKFVRLWGKANIDDANYVIPVSTRSAMRKVMPQIPYPPASLEGQIAVGFGVPFPPFFELQLAEETVFFPQLVGSSQFKLSAKRLKDEFKSAISFRVEGLPEGIKAEVKPVKEGSAEYLVAQTGPGDLPEGVHHIRIVGTATFKNQTKQIVVEKIPFHIVKPLVVRLEPQGAFSPGGRQTVKIKVRRFGQQRHPVVLHWKEGPPYLLAPIQVTVPPDKDEMDVQLATMENTPTETSDTLIAVATTRLKDQYVTVESAPITLQVSP